MSKTIENDTVIPVTKGPKTGPTAPHASVLSDMKKRELDKRLDHALEESFPGSDPVSFDCD